MESALSVEVSAADSIGLDKLDGEFNKLGPSPESQTRVLEGVLAMANRAGADTALVSYTLLKISKEIVLRSASQFFSISAGHAFPLARLVCALCRVKSDMGNLIRAQFNATCPLTVPYLGEDLNREEYHKIMCFEKQVNAKGEESWESEEKWLARQMKTVVTYFVTAVQPEGLPLDIYDCLHWLTNLLNTLACAKKKKAPIITANLLDNVLRTISEPMFAKFGEFYLSLIVVTKEQVLPLLDITNPKYRIDAKRLEQFLSTAIKSKGREFLKL